MSSYLPYGGFKWLQYVDNFDVSSASENSSIGCILEIDLECQDELHVLRNDYPLATEKLEILYDMLSDYCKKVQPNIEQKLVIDKINPKFSWQNYLWASLQKSSFVLVSRNEND